MKKYLNILGLLLIPGVAFAGTIVRPYGPSDYAGGAKAVGSKVNSEFATIASFINGKNIASDNITDLGVNTANINTGAVTKIKQTSNYGITGSSGTYTNNYLASIDLIQVTNLSTTITTSGSKPVLIGLYPEQNGSAFGRLYFDNAGDTSNIGRLWLLRDSSTTGAAHLLNAGSGNIGSNSCGSFSYIDTPVSGTYVYSVRLSAVFSSATPSASVFNCKLVVQEL